jgi:uroporphyrin-3 C-methyltransferase
MHSTPPHDAPAATKAKTNHHPIKTISWLIILLIVIAAIGLAIFHYKYVKQNIDTLKQNLEQQSLTLSQISQQQNKQINDNQSAITQLRQQTSTDAKTWIIPQIKSLIWHANLMLNYEHNIPITIILLKKADAYLQQLSDTKSFNLRKILAEDIAALQALPTIDTNGIYLHLHALNQEIRKAPLIATTNTNNKQPDTTATETTTATKKTTWKSFFGKSLDNIKNVIVIRHHQQPVQPLLTDQQRDLLNLQIQILITQAQWALLQQNNTVYQASLQQIKQLLQQYFLQNNSHIKSILNELTKLQKINLAPQLPDINNAIEAINNIAISQEKSG